jgi:hypothetical protein
MLAIEKGHLPEDILGIQHLEDVLLTLSVAEEYLHRSRLQDEERAAGVKYLRFIFYLPRYLNSFCPIPLYDVNNANHLPSPLHVSSFC